MRIEISDEVTLDNSLLNNDNYVDLLITPGVEEITHVTVSIDDLIVALEAFSNLRSKNNNLL